MRRSYCALILFLMAGCFGAGYWYDHRSTTQAASLPPPRILYYHDPMHPSYKSDKPGIAPDCGMALEPVYSDAQPMADSGNNDLGPDRTVNISPEKQQIAGVRVSAVERTAGSRTIRLFGHVTPEEPRVYKLTAGMDCVLREVPEITTGSLVHKGQVLGRFSAPDFQQSVQAYIFNLDALDRLKRAGAENSTDWAISKYNSRQAVDKLFYLGMSPTQIDEVARTRAVPDFIDIASPADGFVVARNVSLGQKFEKGAEWYRIADLSRVWVLADVFENEAPYFRPGMRAQVSIPGQKTDFQARVSEVLPQFDAASSTLKVRLEVDNPGFALRPDMFVDVRLPVAFAPGLVVPADAVIDSGLKKTVFVDQGNGFFEERPVRTGWRFDDRIEIVDGLAAGERIVVAGTFLVDSESRMKASGHLEGGKQ